MTDQKVDFGSLTSTKIPRFGLIPREALIALANTFEQGQLLHKDKAWNSLSHNRDDLSIKFVAYRLEHAIDHAYKALLQLKLEKCYYDDKDSLSRHAGALMFAGAVLACFVVSAPESKE